MYAPGMCILTFDLLHWPYIIWPGHSVSEQTLWDQGLYTSTLYSLKDDAQFAVNILYMAKIDFSTLRWLTTP